MDCYADSNVVCFMFNFLSANFSFVIAKMTEIVLWTGEMDPKKAVKLWFKIPYPLPLPCFIPFPILCFMSSLWLKTLSQWAPSNYVIEPALYRHLLQLSCKTYIKHLPAASPLQYTYSIKLNYLSSYRHTYISNIHVFCWNEMTSLRY